MAKPSNPPNWVNAVKPRRLRLTPGRVLAGTAVALAAVQVVRMALELRRYRASRSRLRDLWTDIPSPLDGRPLHVRALVSTKPASALPAVVLVHGYGIGNSYLVPLAAELAQHTSVYAPDLPGHGASEHDVRPLTIPELNSALAAWMEAYQLHEALVVGHSMGCQVAVELTTRRPELVSGLVLVGPTSDAEARSIGRQIGRGLRGSAYERPTFAVWTALDYSRAGARVLGREMHELIQHHIEELFPNIHIPVRVVRGARDRIVPQGWAEAVARMAGAPTPTVIGHWGHAVHYDDPAAVAQVALELAKGTHEKGH